MLLSSQFLQSLFLAMITGFMAPLVSVGVAWVGLHCLQWLPGLHLLAMHILRAGHVVLTVFGSGHPWQGVLTIAATCSFVWVLFDTFAYCQYQGCRDR